jgi:hypothetical protein
MSLGRSRSLPRQTIGKREVVATATAAGRKHNRNKCE